MKGKIYALLVYGFGACRCLAVDFSVHIFFFSTFRKPVREHDFSYLIIYDLQAYSSLASNNVIHTKKKQVIILSLRYFPILG